MAVVAVNSSVETPFFLNPAAWLGMDTLIGSDTCPTPCPVCDCAYVHGSSINELTAHARAIEFACMHIGVLAMAGT